MAQFRITILNEKTADKIWSVHDAFGSHPNHIDLLDMIVTKTFFSTHQTTTGVSHLQSLVCNALETSLKQKDKIHDEKTAGHISKMQTCIEKFESQAPEVVYEAITGMDSDDIYLIS